MNNPEKEAILNTCKGTGPLAEPIRQAGRAQEDWEALTWKKRRKVFCRVRDLLVERADQIAGIISTDCGKTLTDALSTEVIPATMALDWYLKRSRKILSDHAALSGDPLMANKRSRLHYHPYGVIGIISPWNYPFSIPFSEVVMALLAGNGVILKVASSTPRVGRCIYELFVDAGLPDGLLAYSELPGAQAGPAMIEGGVDKLFFTGSVEVGKSLMADAARRLTPLVLELGGNDAAIVCADADLELSAQGIIWAGLSNAGQSCGGTQRVLVHESVYEAFCSILKAKVEALRIGDPHDPDIDIGTMVHPRQKAAVMAQVDASLKQGARLLCESPPGPADTPDRAWLTPRVLVDVAPESPIWQEEVFGPVLGLRTFASEAEAVRLANDSIMGLTASVWSKDHRRARKLALGLRAGAVLVNDHLMSHGLAETPWGGVGHSGTGRTHGSEGLREMVWSQVVVDDILPGRKRNPWWHPHSLKVYKGMKSIQTFRFAPGLGKRLGAIPDLLGLFLSYWKK